MITLFEIATYPTATVSVTIPITLLSSYFGHATKTEITGVLTAMFGLRRHHQCFVSEASSSRILVRALLRYFTKPRSSTANSCRTCVPCRASASYAVPVDFALVFNDANWTRLKIIYYENLLTSSSPWFGSSA